MNQKIIYLVLIGLLIALTTTSAMAQYLVRVNKGELFIHELTLTSGQLLTTFDQLPLFYQRQLDCQLLDIFTNQKGQIQLLTLEDGKDFQQSNLEDTTLEDVDWRQPVKYREAIHQDRLYPRIFRSAGIKRWFFSLKNADAAEVSFDEKGEYISATSRGGVMIVPDHLSKAEVVEKWGPPMGGLYPIGCGFWFRNAAVPDTRLGHGGIGSLYLRLRATRNREVSLHTIEPSLTHSEKQQPIFSLEESRLTTFHTNSDGIPAGIRENVSSEDLQLDSLYMTETPTGDKIFLRKNRQGQYKAVSVGNLNSKKEWIPLQEISQTTLPIEKTQLVEEINEKETLRYSQVSNQNPTRILARKNGYLLYQISDQQLHRHQFFTGATDVQSTAVDFGQTIVDAMDCDNGYLLILLKQRLAVQKIDDLLLEDPLSIFQLDPTMGKIITKQAQFTTQLATVDSAISLQYQIFQRVTLLKIPLSLFYQGSGNLEARIPEFTLREFTLGTTQYRRDGIATKNGSVNWQLPSQLVATSVDKQEFYRLLPGEKIEKSEEDLQLDLTLFDANKLLFQVENPPQFGVEGWNLHFTADNADQDKIAGVFPRKTVANSLVYRWKIEYFENNKWLELHGSEVDVVDRQVGFDTNSLWLEMEPLRRFSDETLHFTSTPWLYQVKQQLAPGKYRIVLTLRFDLIDNQGQRTSCQKFGRENLQVFEEFEIKK